MQLALPPAPEPKLLPGNIDDWYVGIDWRSKPSVTLIERFYADGRYECYIDGKLIEGSLYWHGKPPFVMMNWKEIPL